MLLAHSFSDSTLATHLILVLLFTTSYNVGLSTLCSLLRLRWCSFRRKLFDPLSSFQSHLAEPKPISCLSDDLLKCVTRLLLPPRKRRLKRMLIALSFWNLAIGAAYGTAKAGNGIAGMGTLRPELIMKVGFPYPSL